MREKSKKWSDGQWWGWMGYLGQSIELLQPSAQKIGFKKKKSEKLRALSTSTDLNFKQFSPNWEILSFLPSVLPLPPLFPSVTTDICVCLPVTIVHPWNSSRRVISRLSLVLYSKDDSTVMITFISNSLPLEVSLKKKKRNKTNLCCWEWMWKSLVFVKRELESLIFLRLQSPADI